MTALGVVTVVNLVLAAVVVVLTGYRALRNRPVARADLVAAAVLGVAVLGYVGVRVAELVGGDRPPSLGLAIGYLAGIALVMPAAGLVGAAERSRYGPVIVGVGALVVAVLFARIEQVWTRG